MASSVSAAKARSLAMNLKALDLNKLEEGAACCICLQPLLGPDLYEFPFVTPCGHIFGNNCLMKWLAGDNEIKDCPGCRQWILKQMTDEEGEQRALLEELDMHGPRDPIPDDQATWNGRIKCMLSESGRDWAVKAEQLWKSFLSELLGVLDGITTAEEWISGYGVIVRKFLKFGTVERFYELMDHDTAHGSIGTRCVFGIANPKAGLPESYQALCEHLDQRPDSQNPGSPLFLEADEYWYSFLADCHRKVTARYEKLNGDLTAAYKEASS